MKQSYSLLISRHVVVFPDTSSVIEIGRQFSINAVKISQLKFDSKIIIVAQKKHDLENPEKHDLFAIGTLATVKLIKENKDGSLLVELKGEKRVAIINPAKVDKNGKIDEFWKTEIIDIKEKNLSLLKNKKLLNDVISHFETLFDTENDIFQDIKKKTQTSKPNYSKISNALCNLWPSSEINSLEIKQKWLEELDISTRLEMMSKTDFISDADKDEINNLIIRKVNKNLSKQQKEFYLRERLRVIKEELGEAGTKDAEISKIKKWLDENQCPEIIRNKIDEEIKKLELTSSFSNEASIIKSYVDWLMSLPWSKTSEDNQDIEKIKELLDVNHYGLEKVKERIIEFIAVQKRIKKSQGTIICLVGPPGVGKTSLAKSIAESLKKEYVKIALGGVNDEAEIRGHRRTYVGAMPGKIIKALKTAQTMNPVFLLDEIDKIASSNHGDPVSALLEVLDPNQNTDFSDNYIEEPVDLSKVMFIATANYEENIPEALLDRMELIYLTSYTENEKMFISKNNLINEVLVEHGINKKELTFKDSALKYIIQKYTREAGVRALKQQLAAICRKFVKKQFMTEVKKEVIDVEKVREYLKREKYDFTEKEDISIPGIVNGMAYTEYGGDLLPIEINYYPGKGNISLTGNLRDTMKESANVALSYIRANYSEFNLSDVQWADVDVNLHVPAGGVPKDGPSAGVTITTALISAFKKVAVPSNIAMTGEITLRGKVLPIGGLKEKIISAARGGINTIFFPKECEKYLDDIPQEVLKKIKLKPIEHYSEIYNYIFKKQ